MSTTVKRIVVALTKTNLTQLDALKKECGENTSEVIKRALALLHNTHLGSKK